MDIQVVENVTRLNDEVATINRTKLRAAGVFTINMIGSVGCGKTSLIEATVPRLIKSGRRVAIIVGDLATQRDAQRIASTTDSVVQINTGKTCHLEANHVLQAMQRIDLDSIDLLIIENVGNLICPAGFDLGEDCKVGVYSVMHGDDKVAKHPHATIACNPLILTAIDMLAHVRFNLDLFRQDIKQLNPGADLFELSSMSGENFDCWTHWLNRQIDARQQKQEPLAQQTV